MIHHTKCRDIYTEIGISTDIAHAEANITRARSKFNGDKGWTPAMFLKDCVDYYNESMEESGKESSVTLISLFRLADAHKSARHSIESERTLAKLVATSQRVHGETHDFTADSEKTLKRYKRRFVIVKGWRGKHFQALRYVEGENKYTVQGPVTRPRNAEDEKTFTVHVDEIRPCLGLVVTVHGLKDSESHLNGKIADVRTRETGARKYKVHFEEEGLEPCLVGPKNMRVLFELPK